MAVVHLYFNIIGTVLFLTVFYLLNAFIGFSFVDGVVGAKEIAIVHTIFNLSTSIILLPFIKVLEKLAYLTVKDKEGREIRTISKSSSSFLTKDFSSHRLLQLKSAESLQTAWAR